MSMCLTLAVACAVPVSDLRSHPFQEGLQKLLDAMQNGRSNILDKGAFHASCVCSRNERKLLAKVCSKHRQMTADQMCTPIRV